MKKIMIGAGLLLFIPLVASANMPGLQYRDVKTFELSANGDFKVTDYFEQMIDGKTESRTNASVCSRVQ